MIIPENTKKGQPYTTSGPGRLFNIFSRTITFSINSGCKTQRDAISAEIKNNNCIFFNCSGSFPSEGTSKPEAKNMKEEGRKAPKTEATLMKKTEYTILLEAITRITDIDQRIRLRAKIGNLLFSGLNLLRLYTTQASTPTTIIVVKILAIQ
jgi:hypothetical protein